MTEPRLARRKPPVEQDRCNTNPSVRTPAEGGLYDSRGTDPLRDIDIGKRGLAVCLMIGVAEAEPNVEVCEFSTFTADIEAMKAWLVQAGCTHAVMEKRARVRTGNPFTTFWRAACSVPGESRGCQGTQGA